MRNYRFLGILSIFWIFCIWIISISLLKKDQGKTDFKKRAAKTDELSIFEKITYFKVEKANPYLSLNAESLNIKNQKLLDFTKPKGLVLINFEEVYFKADLGFFNTKSKFLSLTDRVNINSKKYLYNSDNLTVDGVNQIVFASGDVNAQFRDLKTLDTLKVSSRLLRSYMELGKTDMIGDVQGEILRYRKYEGKLSFSSNKLSLDRNESRLSLDKKVKIQRNSYDLSAGKAVILLENFNKKLKYYTLYDDVNLTETVSLRSGKVQTRKAYAEKLEAFQAKGEVVLTGAPRVEQGNDIIKGYQIILRENVELVEIDDSQTSFSLKRKD